jgi:hypothetical protein
LVQEVERQGDRIWQCCALARLTRSGAGNCEEGMTTEALSPCPLCGKSQFVTLGVFEGDCSNCGYGSWGSMVICDAAGIDTEPRGCGANTGYCADDAEAVRRWNARAGAEGELK